MDNKMAVFNNREFGSIRVIEENGNYLFCGFDVAKALGYAKPRNAINTHCKGALKRGALTEGGVQELTFIPEGDVYRLIVHSRLPGAERFEKWVFDEVLPMIRKTGGYMTASLLEQAAEKLGGDFYILPSSVHECILVPAGRTVSSEILKEMVTDINHTQVEPQEVLANQVYLYSRLLNKIVF